MNIKLKLNFYLQSDFSVLYQNDFQLSCFPLLSDLPGVRHHTLRFSQRQCSLQRLFHPPHAALHAACGSHWNGEVLSCQSSKIDSLLF